MSLVFGGKGSSAGGSGGGQNNMVEFRAGKMILKGNTCTPDKRKGLVYIYQSEADGLTHFCWKDRKTGTVEDDLIIFPDDCEYKKVTQCSPGSRVFLLKFKASARKLFFWMQEPPKVKKSSTSSTPTEEDKSKSEETAAKDLAEADEDILWKVNSALNNPSALEAKDGKRSSGKGGSKSSGQHALNFAGGAPTEASMQALLSNMSQSQLMQLIGGMNELGGPAALLEQLTGAVTSSSSDESIPRSETVETTAGSRTKPSTTTSRSGGANSSSGGAAAVAASSAEPRIQLSDLQKILSNLGGSQDQQSSVDLSSGVNSDLIKRVISGSSSAALSKLAQLLPNFNAEIEPKPQPMNEGMRMEIEDTLSSPQFQSALAAFCAAFPSGQLGPLISQFEMGNEAVSAAQQGNFEAFLTSIQKDVELKDSDELHQDAEDASTNNKGKKNGEESQNEKMEVDSSPSSTPDSKANSNSKAKKQNDQ